MKVSVIIPCYNAEAHIERCIRSVFSQTFQNIQVICVDNNSNDSTLEILHRLSAKLPIELYSESKKGASAARNKGLAAANGEWIQFVDADDEIYSDKLMRQISMLRSNTQLLVGAYDMSINGGKKEKFNVSGEDPWSLLIKSALGNTCSNLWNKKALEEIGNWDENYQSSQETELMFRLLKQISVSQIVYDTISSMIYHRRSFNSISGNYEANTITRIRLRMKFKEFFLLDRYKNKKLIQEAEEFMLGDLRFLYSMNYKKSIELFESCIDTEFKPTASFITPPYYVLFYHLFGFRFTEFIFSLKNIFSKKQKEHHL